MLIYTLNIEKLGVIESSNSLNPLVKIAKGYIGEYYFDYTNNKDGYISVNDIRILVFSTLHKTPYHHIFIDTTVSFNKRLERIIRCFDTCTIYFNSDFSYQYSLYVDNVIRPKGNFEYSFKIRNPLVVT